MQAYPPRPCNRKTQAAHRRDVRWQILLPLILAGAGGVGLVSLTIVGAPLDRSTWADVSLIFLAAIGMVVILVPGVFFAALAYGVWYLVREAPPYFKIAQDFVALVAFRADEITDRISAVLVRARSAQAGVSRLLGGNSKRE